MPLNTILYLFIKNFAYGCIIKAVLRILTERNIMKILKSFSSIPKFGLVAGLFSLFFNVTRYVLRKVMGKDNKMGEQYEGFICGLVGSLALFFANSGEMSLVKLVVYPRAIECLFELMVERGILRKFKYGDIIAYALQVAFITYNYIYEGSLPAGFGRTIDNYSQYTYDDQQSNYMNKARNSIHIYDKYIHK